MNRRLLVLTFVTAGLLMVEWDGERPNRFAVAAPAAASPRSLIPEDQTRAVQLVLASYGYTITVDGVYGPETTRVVESWQRSNGLTVDGVAGPITQASLGLTPAVRGAQQQVTPTPPPVEHYDQWLRLAECESGTRWDYNGSSGYDGALQFLPSTWRAMGGREFAEYAWQASAVEQMIVAERTLDASGWGAWPACSRKLGFR